MLCGSTAVEAATKPKSHPLTKENQKRNRLRIIDPVPTSAAEGNSARAAGEGPMAGAAQSSARSQKCGKANPSRGSHVASTLASVPADGVHPASPHWSCFFTSPLWLISSAEGFPTSMPDVGCSPLRILRRALEIVSASPAQRPLSN